MRIYLVGSLYTLLNASHLHRNCLTGNEHSLLIVFGSSSSFVSKHLSFFNSLFDHVIFCSHPKDITIVKYLKVKRSISTYLKGFKKDNTSVISQNFSFALFLPLMIRRSADYYFLEEGLSSYTDYNHDLKYRSKKLVSIHKMFPFLGIFPKIKAVLLFEPKIYLGKEKVVRLPAYTDDFMSLLISAYDSIKANLIFLGTPLHTLENVLSKKLDSDQSREFQVVASYTRDRMIDLLWEFKGVYKAHPLENDVPPEIPRFNSNGPWELQLKTLPDNATLISYFSTALITPKLLYGKEPRLIFLFRLISDFEFFMAEEVVLNLRKVYSDPSRVCLPESWDELEKLLKKCA